VPKPMVVAVLALCGAFAAAAPASAQLPPLPLPVPVPLPGQPTPPTPQPYGTNDHGGFRNILPPGASGFDNGPQLIQFEATGQRPPHADDQRDMYANLVGAAPNIGAADLPSFFKDATFGVLPQNAERTYSPRPDVTIVRDRFGVPHIYGSTRAGTMFGIGYATAEDRLFFIDVLRHLGRAELSSFAGGAPGNRAMDEQQWAVAPYTEADLQHQIDQGLATGRADGQLVKADADSFLAGINQYIAEAKLNPLKMPAEYAAIGRPQGADDFTEADIVSIASLVGGIFGKGGGEELPWAQLLQNFQQRLGAKAGRRAWLDFRDPNDPEAPTTVHDGARFPYRTTPRHVAKGSVAMPDRGSVKMLQQIVGGAGDRGGSSSSSSLVPALPLPRSNSNALLVSGAHTQSGHPIAVFGPQVGYFAPQILMEEDVHGPGIDADGAAFPGVNMYVELGHGEDYAWSATSAGQDIIDTFALPLCNPSGGKVSADATTYLFHRRCVQMETLTRTNSWTPNLADQTPPGSETLTALRTKLGIVIARARIHGKPVVYTQLRSTYFHEIDSARGFLAFNDPSRIHGPADFQAAASQIGYTFNWFYADSKHIAYFNSGANPVRAANTDPRLPVWGRFDWKGWNPDSWTEVDTPPSTHPQVVDQDYLTSWNNKQAPGYAAPDTDTPYTSLYRNLTLDDRVKAGIRNGRKMSLVDLVNAMGDAGTVDVRGAYVLPHVLAVLRSRPVSDPALRTAIAQLSAWVAAGAHRRDLNHDGVYEHSAAIRIMDAWWPRLVKAQFGGVLGSKLLGHLEAIDSIDNTPNGGGSHLGSAWDVGFYGTVQKDLRRVLGKRVRGRLSRVYCGAGRLTRCRAALLASLKAAMAVPASTLYHDSTCAAAKRDGSQTCFDSISFRALGAITEPLIPWINRPTFQQAVEVQSSR